MEIEENQRSRKGTAPSVTRSDIPVRVGKLALNEAEEDQGCKKREGSGDERCPWVIAKGVMRPVLGADGICQHRGQQRNRRWAWAPSNAGKADRRQVREEKREDMPGDEHYQAGKRIRPPTAHYDKNYGKEQ
jgi:hypothetical protein